MVNGSKASRFHQGAKKALHFFDMDIPARLLGFFVVIGCYRTTPSDNSSNQEVAATTANA